MIRARYAALPLAAAALVATTAVGACRSATPAATAMPDGGRVGDLVEAKPLPDIDPAVRATGAQAFRIRYRSTSAWGGKTVIVSGAAFVPAGQPPAGGWPVMAVAHGTSGILQECGPSLSPNLFGGTGAITGLLAKGFAVVAPDYEGLGEPGVHAYLDAKAAGFNVIDAVRALHALRPGAFSPRWLVMGGSQGGGAVWAAAEQAPGRAPKLPLAGAVALVPAADFTAYVDLASAGKLGFDQTAAYVWMLMAQGRGDPTLDLNQYRRGSAARNWQALSYCYGPHAQERVNALKQITPDELKPATPDAARRLKRRFAAMALPQRRTPVPMLVIYAGRDSFLDPAWTRGAVARACRLGSPAQAIFQPDKEHGTVDIAPAIEWLGQRLAGAPVRDACR